MGRRSLRKVLTAAALAAACTSDGTQPPPSVATVDVTAASSTIPITSSVQLTAVPRDANGNALSGRTVVWSSGDTAVATVSAAGLVTGRSLGAATITATVEGHAGAAAVTVVAGPAARLIFIAQPTNVAAGDSIAPAVTVGALDAFGNAATSFTGAVSLALGANPGTATLSGTRTRSGVAGVATFDDLHLDKVGAGYTLVASSGALTTATSNGFDVSPAGVSAAQSSVVAAPAAITAGGGAGGVSTVTVTARDAFGNPLSGLTVLLAVSGLGNSITQPGAPTDAAGVATGSFSSTAAEAKTASATVNGVPVTQTASVTVTAGSATRLAFTTEPTTAVADAVISPAVTVTALDAFGNPATAYAGSVTVAIAANPAQGTLAGTTTVAVTSGVATFTGLSIDKSGTGYTLRATASPTLTPDTSAAFNITTGTPTKLGFSVQPANTTGGTVINPAVQVEVQDAGGNRVAGATNSVTLALGANPKSGTLSGTLTQAAVNGVATFANLTIDSAATGYTLAAAAVGLAGTTSNPFNVTVGVAAKLGFLGQPANATGGSVLSPAVTVEVRDAGGNRVTTATNSVTVAIGTNPNSGTLGGTRAVAASAGVASFTTLTLDSAGAGYTLTAGATGLAGGTSSAFTISVGSAARLGFRVQPSNTAGGATITPAVQVEVRDLGGNRVTTATTSITVAIGTNPGGGTLSGTNPVSAVNGLATFADLVIDKDGTGYTLTAAGGSLTGATSAPFNIAVGGATKLAFFVQPANTSGGVAITPAVQVEVQDAGGNRVTSATDGVTLALGTNPKSGTLAGTLTRAAVNGVATFANLTIDSAATGYTLTAAAGGLAGATSDPFTVTVGAAAKLVYGQQPTDATGGAMIAPPVTVRILDLGGNLTASTASVTLAITAGTGTSGAHLSGGSSVTVAAVGGIATFSALSIDSAGAGYTLRATSGTLPAATSSAFAITVGAAAKLAFGQQPTTDTAGKTISPTVSVRILDAGGNLTTSTAPVSLAITSGTGTAGAHLSGGAASAVGGVATFGSLSIDSAGTGYTLTATSGTLPAAVSSAFTIAAGTPAKLVFGQQPTSTTGGATLAPAVTVRILDAVGNLTASTASVSVAITSGTGTGGAHLSGGTSVTVTAVAGIATFGNLSIDSAGTGYTLRATSGTLTAATSNPFSISVGPAAKLGFLVQPATSASGAAITPAVQVEVRDLGGNRVISATTSITLAIGTNPSGGVLSGTNPKAAVAGVATFSDLSIDKSGTGYTLTAAGGSLTGATSATFNITGGAADHLGFFVQPSNDTAGSLISPAVQVEVLDAAGNRVTTDTRNITVAIFDNPGGGTLSGTKTVAASAGVASFSGLSIDKAGTGYTLQATSTPALTSAISVDFNIAPGTASRAHFFVEPSTTTAGVSIAPAVQVEILDAFGNRVGTATNSVTVALLANPGGGALTGTTTRNASAGVATFNNLKVNKAASGYTLLATASAVSIRDTSIAFTIVPAAATQLVFTTPPSNTAAGATMSPVVVTARDNLGNTATGFTGTVTMAITANPGSGTLSGTLGVAAASGVATFSDLSIDKVGTGYTLTAAATGPSSTTSGTFNITVGGAARLAFGQQPTATTGGATISPAVTVRILDANGNLTASTANVTLALTPGTGTAGAHLSGGSSVTVAASGGVATFGSLSVDSAGNAYTLNASSGVLVGDTSSAFNVAVGAAAKLGFVGQPSNAPPGATITPAVQVEIRDAGGNRVTTDNSTNVTVAIGTNPPPGGALAGTLTQPAVAGVATFPDLSINSAGSGYTLTAVSSPVLTGTTSSAFDIVVGTATKLAFIAQPSNTTGGATMNSIQVQVQDAGGNPVATATNSVTLAIGTNPNGGHLSGTKTVAAVSGVATFTTLSIDSAGTGYALGASSSGLSSATSNSFNVTVGPATKLGFRVQPSNATGGANIAPAVQVEIRDAGGNRVTSASNSVAMAISTNPNGGTLAGTTPLAAVNGLATFNNLRIDSAGTGYRLSATASGLGSATSNTFSITVGVAAKLGFLAQPSDAVAGSPITPAVKVEIRDAGGNRVTTAANTVAVAIGTNPGGGTLSGTKSVSAVSGVATFSTLSIDKKGSGYTLQATSGPLTAATSSPFAISADGVSASLSGLSAATDTISQCSFSCVPGIHASTVTVTVQDQFGNLVDGAPVTLSASGSGNGFTPSATGTTDANGVFTAAFNSSVFEAKTVSATAGGIGITQTAPVAVMPVLVGAGDIADCFSTRDDATANQLDSIPGTVFANGDNAYPNGTPTNFANCYDPTWGRQKARTKPVLGNHEYDSSATAAGHFAYFGAAADPLGNGIGYYSFDLGTWHIVVLNSEPAGTASGQLTWLQGDLAATSQKCILALWHEPIFTSGASGGAGTKVRRLWQALENVGADLVINGHDHLYERFAPQDSLGNANPAGIREFIVGTGGGETHSNYVNTPANVEASDAADFSRGVLRLTLYDKSYRWEFLHAQGQGTYSDSGTAACH